MSEDLNRFAAMVLGRTGGKKGMEMITPEERRERARKAGLASAKKRWGFQPAAEVQSLATGEEAAPKAAASPGSPTAARDPALSASRAAHLETALREIVARGARPATTVAELVALARAALGEASSPSDPSVPAAAPAAAPVATTATTRAKKRGRPL